MRSSRASPPVDSDISCDSVERVRVMMEQDGTAYRCRDYLDRRTVTTMSSPSNRPKDDATSVIDGTSTRECPPLATEELVDAVCREKMCEWSYRVCDHFHTGREIVAISFSFLDRFIDRCSCDRTAFKLAAMTTLYLATKIFNSRQITISSLAELSRGEFEMAHIQEMEGIILQTLGWRLHPTTPQCFINALYGHLPVPRGPVATAIYQRAVFFAELSMYDYNFVSKERSLIAIAALLNAMEGMDEAVVSKEQRGAFLNAIHGMYGMSFPLEHVENARNRLWYVYSMSAQYKEDDVISPHAIKQSPNKHLMESEVSTGLIQSSPVCVTMSDRRYL
jgi:hypothetical protein